MGLANRLVVAKCNWYTKGRECQARLRARCKRSPGQHSKKSLARAGEGQAVLNIKPEMTKLSLQLSQVSCQAQLGRERDPGTWSGDIRVETLSALSLSSLNPAGWWSTPLADGQEPPLLGDLICLPKICPTSSHCF